MILPRRIRRPFVPGGLIPALRVPPRACAAAAVLYLLVALDMAAAVSVKHDLRAQATQSPVFTEAVAALAAAPAVRVTGDTTLRGTAVHLDVVAGQAGGGGSVSIGPVLFDVVLDGQVLYVKGGSLTWSQLGYGPAAPRLADRWLSAPRFGPPFQVFGDFLTTGSLASLLADAPRLAPRRRTTVGGVAVLPLVGPGGSATTVYVSASGTPVLVGERQLSGFLAFDRSPPGPLPTAPSGAVPLASLLPRPAPSQGA